MAKNEMGVQKTMHETSRIQEKQMPFTLGETFWQKNHSLHTLADCETKAEAYLPSTKRKKKESMSSSLFQAVWMEMGIWLLLDQKEIIP